MNLDQRIVVVTGGTRGIGAAIVEEYMLQGAHVIITGTHPEEIDRLNREKSERKQYVWADFLNPSSLTGLIDYIARLERLDVCINNAGINIIKDVEQVTAEDFEKIAAVNFRAPYLLSQAAAKVMRRQHRGWIVNIGSIWSVITKPGRTLYSATKSGLAGMTRALATDLAAEGWHLGIFGGRESMAVAERIVRETDGQNHAGKLSFRETAAELRRYPFYIGGDTGLSHFATLICQNVLVIMGGGTFRRFFPWPLARNQHVLFHGMDCFDCDWSCKHPERYCLTRIEPRNVVEQLDGMVKGAQAKERDLNPVNERYPIGWRRSCAKATRGGWSQAEAEIRPDAGAAHGAEQ